MHIAKLFYFPATKTYEIRCIECGETLVKVPEDIETVFDFPGCCNPPETLGIKVKENIGVKEKVG